MSWGIISAFVGGYGVGFVMGAFALWYLVFDDKKRLVAFLLDCRELLRSSRNDGKRKERENV